VAHHSHRALARTHRDNGVLLRPNVPMNLSFFGTQPFTMASFKQDFSILTVRNTY